jgi:hypothetical protein
MIRWLRLEGGSRVSEAIEVACDRFRRVANRSVRFRRQVLFRTACPESRLGNV